MLAALNDPTSELHATSAAMVQSATGLLTRAQEAGVVRADIEAEDLFTAAAAAGWVAEYAGPDRAGRVLSLLDNGLGHL